MLGCRNQSECPLQICSAAETNQNVRYKYARLEKPIRMSVTNMLGWRNQLECPLQICSAGETNRNVHYNNHS